MSCCSMLVKFRYINNILCADQHKKHVAPRVHIIKGGTRGGVWCDDTTSRIPLCVRGSSCVSLRIRLCAALKN